MFNTDPSLLNVQFEGYKLDQNWNPQVHDILLPANVVCWEQDAESSGQELQVLADSILRNSLLPDGRFILIDGSICDTSGTINRTNIDMTDAMGPCSVAGVFVSTGHTLWRSNATESVPLNLRFAPSEYAIHLLFATEEYLIVNQIVPAAALKAQLKCTEKHKSIFLISLLNANNLSTICEYVSWSRPFFACIIKDTLLLGSSTGFSPLKGAELDDADVTEIEQKPIDMVEEHLIDEEDDESCQFTSLILRAFKLDQPSVLFSAAPPATYIAHRLPDKHNQSLLLALQIGVDAVVFSLDIADESLTAQHIYTLDAFAFVQAGKPRKRLLGFAEGLAVLAEVGELVFLYQRIDGKNWSRQALVNLGSKEPIIGLQVDSARVTVLTPSALKIIQL